MKNTLRKIIIQLTFFNMINSSIKMELNKEPIIQQAPCHVKKYDEIKAQENIFLQKRTQLIKSHLEKTIGTKIQEHQVPIISICCSGGGFRSMLATTGFLCGADSIGLLDCTTYISSLSGSCWALIPWILKNQKIGDFEHDLIEDLNKFYKLKKIALDINQLKDIKNFFSEIFTAYGKIKKEKKLFDQKISLIDWYGIFLANLLLKNFQEKFDLKLSDLSSKIEIAHNPFPIFTAVSQFDHFEYQWLEFTPYQVGSSYLDSYITPKDFGKKFNNGISTQEVPEISLGYLMAVFGSAFSTNFNDLLKRLTLTNFPQEIQNLAEKTESKIDQSAWANKKISSAKIPNFTYGMNDSPIKNMKDLNIVDGGYLCNLPLQPLLTRKSDIIFVLDNSNHKSLKPAIALKLAQDQAKAANQKFPPIDYQKILTENFSIFKDEKDPTNPIVIYIQLKKDKTYNAWFNPFKAKYCSTTNFFYSKKQATLLCGLTEHIVKQHKDEIWDVIKQRVTE